MPVGDLRHTDLNLLVALDALLHEESVTRAAERLGLSTPAMSHTLSRLRAQLGDPVLVRAGRGMVATTRGLQMRDDVRALIERIGEVLEPQREFEPHSLERTFVVHASDYIVLVVGQALDARLRKSAPNVAVRFMPNAEDARALREGRIDLAVGVYHDLPPELRIRRLFEERLVCAVRRRHPAVKKRLSLKQYTDLPHIQIAPGGRGGGLVDTLLAEQGRTRVVARSVPSFFAGVSLASRTDYVLTAPERLLQANANRFSLRVLHPPIEIPPYTVSQLWHPRTNDDLGHRWFRQQFVTACEAVRG